MRKSYGKIDSLKDLQRQKRRLSIRKKVSGTEIRPRVCATKSNKHLSVQIINDVNSTTFFTVSTFGKNAVEGNADTRVTEVGKKIATQLKAKNISAAVFDRAGYRYTGIIAKLAQSIRENGIQI
jgi:large subunit ribosomal protein L18